MTNAEQKAYEDGYRIGEFHYHTYGVEDCLRRGSMANIRYRSEKLRTAYNKGFWDAVKCAC